MWRIYKVFSLYSVSLKDQQQQVTNVFTKPKHQIQFINETTDRDTLAGLERPSLDYK